jgi:steroid 5-alpha reductase family enzyme
MSPLLSLAIGWAAMAVVMALLWSWQRRTRNAGVVDVAWSFGVGTIGVAFALVAPGWWPRRALVALLVGIWAARLGLHLAQRVFGRDGLDGRYLALEQRWGADAQRKLFWFFQVQAFWSVLFAAPMLLAASNGVPEWRWTDALGLAIGVLAIAGETTADRQLAAFKRRADAKVRVMDQGLWAWSRHPNYFFEWLHWFAYVAIAQGDRFAAWSWLGPALMLFFLLYLTGIPHTEAQALRTRGEAYRAYQRSTSKFFLWPPRREARR